MTNDDDRRAAAELERAIYALWGADIAEDTAQLTLAGKRDKTTFTQAFAAHRIAAERRGIERAAQVADEHACQHCAHISAAIRSLITD